jgi:hypothetical protein
MGVIYMLYDENGYAYIGQTKKIGKRLRHHHNDNRTYSRKLNEWKCEILEECDNDCLLDYEQYWYDFYNELFPNMLINYQRPNQSKREYILKVNPILSERRKLKRNENKEEYNKYHREYNLKNNTDEKREIKNKKARERYSKNKLFS